jgi:hypothetical protein
MTDRNGRNLDGVYVRRKTLRNACSRLVRSKLSLPELDGGIAPPRRTALPARRRPQLFRPWSNRRHIVAPASAPVVFPNAAELFLGAQLYGASPFNPGVVLAAALALAVSALLASWVPAFRASMTSPVDALRAE